MKIPFTNIHLKAERLQRVQVSTVNDAVVSYMGGDQKAYIKQGYKKNANVYSVINWIVKKAAMTHWQLFEIVDGEKQIVYKHPLLDLMNRPNPTQGKAEFIESMLGYKLLCGESFVYQISPDNGVNMGVPQELWTIAPPLMSVGFDAFGIPKKYEVQAGARRTEIPSDKVIYMKYWNPDSNSKRGMSPIEAGRRVITQSNDSYTASMKLLQNLGAQGILSVDDDVEMTQEQIDALETKYAQKYGGPENYGRIIVSGAKMGWTQIGLPATDLELIDSQKMSLRDICNLYNLSSQLFNDPDNKTYSNMKEAKRSGISDVVIPEMELIADEFNRWLVPHFEKQDGKEYMLEMDKGIFTELKEDEQMLATILTNSWWLTPNEKRERMGMGKLDIDGMDDVFAPTSIIPLGFDATLEKAYSTSYTPKELKETLKQLKLNGSNS